MKTHLNLENPKKMGECGFKKTFRKVCGARRHDDADKSNDLSIRTKQTPSK
jgi:hypothetical protein